MTPYNLKGALQTRDTNEVARLKQENAELRSRLEIAQEAFTVLKRERDELIKKSGQRKYSSTDYDDLFQEFFGKRFPVIDSLAVANNGEVRQGMTKQQAFEAKAGCRETWNAALKLRI